MIATPRLSTDPPSAPGPRRAGTVLGALLPGALPGALKTAAVLLGVLLLLLPGAAPALAQETGAQTGEVQGGEPRESESSENAEAPEEEEGAGEATDDAEDAEDTENDGDADAAGDDEDDADEEPDPERIRFTLPLEDGGVITGSAAALDFVRDDYAQLVGDVALQWRDYELTAQQVAMDLTARTVEARGNVVLDQGPRRLTGATLDWDLDAETGTLTEATAYVDPDYYFSGTSISKVEENLYTVTDGLFTSCEDEVPAWSFHLGEAEIEVEGYARVKNASMRVENVPVFYTPYILWPTKTERTSGLLVPNLGYSERRGAYLGLAYYQVLGRSYDSTFYFDGYSEGFYGIGNELRYRPSEETEGRFEGYALWDDERGEWRWKGKLEHVTTDLPWGMRGVADITQSSDFEFFQDFERDFDRTSRRFVESRAFVSGAWGQHLLDIEATERETFRAAGVETDRRLPQATYRLRQTALGDTPLYLSVDSSLAWLQVDRSPTYDNQYGRFDLFPRLALPFEPVPWLSVSLSAGHRFTWWGDSLETDPTVVADSGDQFSGDTLTRSQSLAEVAVVGPSLAKVFDTPRWGFSRFRHVIEPRVTYRWVDDYDDQSLVPRFDGTDGFFGVHEVRVSLINRIKAKEEADEDDPASGSSREIFNFEVSQRFSLDDPLLTGIDESGEPIETTRGPVEGILRVAPSPATELRFELLYDSLYDRITAHSLATSVRRGRNDLDLRLTTRYDPLTGETFTNQLRLGSGLALVPGKLGLRAFINYDIEASELQEQRYFLDYTAQCYSIRLEYRDFQVGQERDTDYRIAFTLKNVGTFLDLTGRVD